MKIWYNYFNIRTKELSMLIQQNILKYLTEHKQEFQEKYNIESIGLFGSYARDEANMASEIDILVSLQKTTLSALEDIELYFKTSVAIIQLHERMNDFLKKRIERDVIYV